MARSVIAASLILVFASLTQAQAPGSPEAEVVAVRRQTSEAIAKKDRAVLERYWADEFSCIHSNGVVRNKKEEISAALSSSGGGALVETDELRVHVYGDVAVVTGRDTNTGSQKGFQPGARRFTDLFVRRDGRWQMVACQATLVQVP